MVRVFDITYLFDSLPILSRAFDIPCQTFFANPFLNLFSRNFSFLSTSPFLSPFDIPFVTYDQDEEIFLSVLSEIREPRFQILERLVRS